MEPLAVSDLCQELNRLLDIKEHLLRVSFQEGVILRRDDPEFLECFAKADRLIDGFPVQEKKGRARRILGHIRQFNPFNSSDVDENDLLEDVVEDFLNFTRNRIQNLSD